MVPTLRVMRLWRDGMATPIYSGLSLDRALIWIDTEAVWKSGRLWIELEKQPAVELDSLWRPEKGERWRS